MRSRYAVGCLAGGTSPGWLTLARPARWSSRTSDAYPDPAPALALSSGEGKVGAWGSLSASKKLPVQPNKVPATGMKELK